MMSLDEEKKSMSDAYWRAREAADGGREAEPPSDEPKADIGPPPPVPPDVAPPPPGIPEFSEYPAAEVAAADDNRKKRLAALEEAKRLAAAPLNMPGNDRDLVAAQASDRAQRGRNDFTEAIQAMLMRRPMRTSAPQDADDLIKRRQLAESSALKQRGQQLSIQEQIAKALTEPKTSAGGMSEWQIKQWERQGKLDEAARLKAEADAKRHAEQDAYNRTRNERRDTEYERHNRVEERRPRAGADAGEKLGSTIDAAIESHLYDEQLKKLGGGDIVKGAEKLISMGQGALPVLRAFEADRSNGVRSTSAVEMAQKKEGVKQAAELEEGMPVGWKAADGYRPTRKQKEDMAKVITNVNETKAAARDLQKAIEESGGVSRRMPWSSNEQTRLRSLVQRLKDKIRVSEDFGVPSGKDMEMIANRIADPTEWKTLLTDFPAQLAEMNAAMEAKLGAQASIGFVPSQQAKSEKKVVKRRGNVVQYEDGTYGEVSP